VLTIPPLPTNPVHRLMREMETEKHELEVERNLCKLALLQVRLEVFTSHVYFSCLLLIFNRLLDMRNVVRKKTGVALCFHCCAFIFQLLFLGPRLHYRLLTLCPAAY